MSICCIILANLDFICIKSNTLNMNLPVSFLPAKMWLPELPLVFVTLAMDGPSPDTGAWENWLPRQRLHLCFSWLLFIAYKFY